MSYQPPPGPPYPGYPPPMPPQRPSAFAAARANFQRMPMIARVLVAAFALFVVCACLGVAASAGNNSNKTASATATIAPQAQATHAPTATSTPKATATPAGPHILTGATLGGLQDAFQATYGTPTGTGTAKSYSFTIKGKSGIVTATPFSTSVSSDGKDHIASLRIGPDSATWDAATAQPICEAFLPPDAVFVKTQNVPDYGPERIYTSADLALSFDAAEFTDSTTDQAVTPGTFAMELWPGIGLNRGCIIILGQ